MLVRRIHWIAERIAPLVVVAAACSNHDADGSSSGDTGGVASTGGHAANSSGASTTQASPSAKGGATQTVGSSTVSIPTGGALSTGVQPSVGGASNGGANSNSGKPEGGVTALGGATTVGGTAPKGGTTPMGGAAPNGSTSKGGATNQGGATNTSATTGGIAAKGGSAAVGGTSAKAGATATAGASSKAGSTATGGATATGGVSAQGGMSVGGSNANCTLPTPSNSPIGYGAAVTGGGNATAVEVNSMDTLVAALTKYKQGTTGLVIKYTGKFDFSTITDPCAQHAKDTQVVDFKDMSNVTLIGAPGAALNFGLHFSRVSNIIIRNLRIGLVPGAGDAIGIESDSFGFWIDHNELFSSMVECEGAGDLEFDGLLDIKDGSHTMTFSYNYFRDHHKVGLMGSGDSDLGDRFVTLHHNRYDNVGSRTPLQRGGTTHIYNNYYNDIMVTGINVRMGGIALIESNYFENAKNPVTSRDSDSIGYWDLRNNFVGAAITWTTTDDPYANANAWNTSKAFTATLGYSYTADPAACVKAIALASAGAKL